jgi:hypothetical protein
MLVIAFALNAGCGDRSPRALNAAPEAKNNPASRASRFELRSSPVDGAESILFYPLSGDPQNSYFCIYRRWEADALELIVNCSVKPTRVDFYSWFSSSTIIHSATMVGDALVFAAYDPEKNLSNGSSSTGGENDSISIFLLSRDGRIEMLAGLVPLSPLDAPIYLGVLRGDLHVCDARRCFRINGGGHSRLPWPLDGSLELVEIKFVDGLIKAIARSPIDRLSGAEIGGVIYSYVETDGTWTRFTGIDPGCIPFNIGETTFGSVPYRCATTRADFRALLDNEISKFAFGGLMNFGSGNSEGRIAWSQYYYLVGFSAVLDGSAPNVGSIWEDVSALRRRTCAELELIARRGKGGIRGYESKRYSLNRQPGVFALHLGRIATVLSLHPRLSCEPGQSITVAHARTLLARELSTLAATIEEWSDISVPGRRPVRSLRYRVGSVFWADGAPVPYNYVSGVLAGALDGADAPEKQRQISHEYSDAVGYFISTERLDDAQTWNYWWGFGASGWVFGQVPSLNTPNYTGYRERADISYRSMDAEALLATRVVSPDQVPPVVEVNIRRLVGVGGLNPEVNRRLWHLGRAEPLSNRAEAYYARAALHSEIGSMVWALESILSDSVN